MATAKQRAWRAKFAAMYGKKRHKARKTGGNMARRKYGRRKASGGLFSGKGVLGKYIPVGGILGGALAGIATYYLAEKFAPQLVNSDITRAGIGLIGGGVGGAAGAYMAPQILGTIGMGSSTATSGNAATW